MHFHFVLWCWQIRLTATPVKVMAEASIVFPLMVVVTFAKDVEKWKEDIKDCVCWIDDLNDDDDKKVKRNTQVRAFIIQLCLLDVV